MNPWLTLEEAETYFDTRFGASRFWVTGIDKEAALITAQMDIETSGAYSFETGMEITAAIKNAVCEQALFLVQNPDMDERRGLIAQGVTQSNIVGEYYRSRTGVIISSRADAQLRAVRIGGVNSFPFEK